MTELFIRSAYTDHPVDVPQLLAIQKDMVVGDMLFFNKKVYEIISDVRYWRLNELGCCTMTRKIRMTYAGDET